MDRQRGRLVAMFAPAGVLATVIVGAVAPLVLGLAFVAGIAVLISNRAAHGRDGLRRAPPAAAEPIEPRTVTIRHLGAGGG